MRHFLALFASRPEQADEAAKIIADLRWLEIARAILTAFFVLFVFPTVLFLLATPELAA